MPGNVTIRPARADDLPAIRAILTAHEDDAPVTTVDIVGPYLRRCLEHGMAFVSVEAGSDRVVAYGAAVDAGVAVHLADLFVVPDRLGQGIGRPLLDAVFGDAPRRTTFASADPRAMPLYIRAGMAPLWPSLYLQGDSRALPEPVTTLATEPAAAARLAALEQEWTGADRPGDHAHWASQPEADSFLVTRGGTPVALAHARARQVGDARTLNRLLVRPGEDPVGPVLVALRRAGRGGPVIAFVPGPSPVAPVLLAARFRIVDRDQYMASEPGLIDPLRIIPNPGLL